MTAEEPIYQALLRLEHADIPEEDRLMLTPAFNALHGGEGIPLRETVIDRIRELDTMFKVK